MGRRRLDGTMHFEDYVEKNGPAMNPLDMVVQSPNGTLIGVAGQDGRQWRPNVLASGERWNTNPMPVSEDPTPPPSMAKTRNRR